jgi:hypothetical protein
MKRFLLLLVAVLTSCVEIPKDEASLILLELKTVFNGDRYKIKITEFDLASSPGWNGVGRPPLAASEAELVARRYAELVFSCGVWQRNTIDLRKIRGNRWVYVVSLFPPWEGELNGLLLPVEFVVFLNGRISPLVPEVSVGERNYRTWKYKELESINRRKKLPHGSFFKPFIRDTSCKGRFEKQLLDN